MLSKHEAVSNSSALSCTFVKVLAVTVWFELARYALNAGPVPAKVEPVVITVPELSGSVSVRSELLFGLAMVNVPVPEALPDRVILDNLVLLGGFWDVALGKPR